jgi:hypothetical protein
MYPSTDRQKEAAGALATFVWIGSGLAFYVFTDGVSIFSWSSLLFFIPGTFAAALVLGGGTYLLQLAIAKVLPIREGLFTSTRNSVAGLLMIPVECVMVFLIARMVFKALT